MAGNRKNSDSLHDQLNPYFNTKTNPNWRALIDAIGESDDGVAELVSEVRRQFYLSTADRPYIDRLGANLNINRPKVVGMDDPTYRKYVPVLAYQPKQVKLILDQLMGIFFFQEATTSFVESLTESPFYLKTGWELVYAVDNLNEEVIRFSTQDFSDITAATAEEIAAAINRQAKYSFAISFDNRILRKKYVRIFTKTIGAKGSIKVTGGRANIALKFLGTILDAGSNNSTIWNISKIGDTMQFTQTGGAPVGLDHVQVGDRVIMDIDMLGGKNTGSFDVTDVDLVTSSFQLNNVFGTVGIFDHGLVPDMYVRFLRPQSAVVWTQKNRAIVWETNPGEIIIEMPSTPPVVRRQLKGSAHINGLVRNMVSYVSSTSLTLDDATDWPIGGQFTLEPTEEIQSHILTPSEDNVTSQLIEGRLDEVGLHFSYTGKSGNTLTGISPPLPIKSGIFEYVISTANRTSNIMTVNTTTPHSLEVGDSFRILDNTSGTLNIVSTVLQVISSTQFKIDSFGVNTSGTGGLVRIERIGLASGGTRVYLTSARAGEGIVGPYVWDLAAPFVLAAFLGKTATDVKAGNIVLNLQIDTPNNIPNVDSFIIFDYGLETQEGPVRMLYKASDGVIALDPAYVFQYNHPVGSNITTIRRKGAPILGGLGKEYAFYTSDPAAARLVLQELIGSIKSVGTFLRYVISFPKLYYSDLDIYSKTTNPLD